MPPRLLPLVLVSLSLGAIAGCRVFESGLVAWRANSADERVESSAQVLNCDLWRPNTGWSPLHLLPEVPISDPDLPLARWSHPKLVAALAEAENAGLITASARRDAESSEAGCRPAPGESAVGETAVNDWFATLARRNDLAGWNAAILWAHYDPIAARQASGVLALLVKQPPSYTPGVKPMTDQKAASDQQKAIVVSSSLQCAAAEAWCLVLAAGSNNPEKSLAPAGVVLQSGKLNPKIEDELMLGIARWVRPDRIPRLAQALEEGERKTPQAVAGRRAAAEACVLHAVQLRLQKPAPPKPAPMASGGRESAGGSEQQAEWQTGNDAEALAAAAGENAPWPRGIWTFRNDPDPRLRKHVGELAAVTGHPAALSILKSQMGDVDNHVREAAILNLGVLGTAAARAELATQAKRNEERPRELAIQGLACQGPAALNSFTSDKSFRVRAEVAKCLRRVPSPAAARVIRELMNDASVEVQGACVRTIRDWPQELATPLLLEALAGGAFKTRQTALKQLEDRRGGGLAFPLYAGPQERALRVEQWTRDWGIPDAALERVRELTQAGSPVLDQARLADLRERLHWSANAESNDSPASASQGAIVPVAAQLDDLAPSDLPLLERLLAEADPTQADMLLHQALPRLSLAYAALVQLEAADVAVRRDAAMKLGRIGEEASVSPGACRRLHELLKTEQDSLVWRFAMLAVSRDGSEEAARISMLAINSHWPDVRVLGCEYVGRHAQREHAVWLLPAIHDANRQVQLAAVTAAGKCQNPIVLDGLKADGDQAGLRGLRPLLIETQGPLQLAVVGAMSRLGDPQAMQELARLALDGTATARLETVQTMGDTGQTRFVAPLIRLAWTEQNQHVRQAALASLQKLVAAAERPSRLGQARNIAEAVEIWASWWEDRKTKRSDAQESTRSSTSG